MRQRMSRPVNCIPSLWVWAVVMCLPVLTYALYQYFSMEYFGTLTYNGKAFITVNSERLHKFSKGRDDKSRFRVVILGTSLTKNATYPENGGDFSLPGGFANTEIDVLNIHHPGAQLAQFTALTPRILEAQPDVLIVHSDLFDKLPLINKTRHQRLRVTVKRWFRRVLWFVHARKRPDPARAEWRNQSRRNCREKNIRDLSIRAEGRYVKKPVLSRSFIELVAQANQRGIRIVVLHMSRHSVFRQYYIDSLRQWQASLQSALLPFKNIQRWNSPEDFAQEDYCDFAHLNDSGREKFTAWLVPRIMRLKDERVQP